MTKREEQWHRVKSCVGKNARRIYGFMQRDAQLEALARSKVLEKEKGKPSNEV